MAAIDLIIGGGSGVILEPTLASTQPRTGLTTVSGTHRAQTPGQTFVSKQFTGPAYHEADGVNYIDCEFDQGIGTNSAPSGNPSATRKESVYFENCLFHGMVGNYGGMENTYFKRCGFDANFTQLQINDAAGYTAKFLTMEECWLSASYTWTSGDPDYHFENLHTGGIQGVNLLYNSWSFYGPDANSRSHITADLSFDISFAGTNQKTTDANVIGNWFRNGGAYQVYMRQVGGVVNYNKFFSHTGGGSLTTNGTGSVWTATGNTLDGAPFPLAPA